MAPTEAHSNSNIEIENAPGKYKSAVWKVFGFLVTYENDVKKVNKECTVCKLCYAKMRYTGNTTNMSTHVRRHHPSSTEEMSGAHNMQNQADNGNTTSSTSLTKSVPGQMTVREAFKQKLPQTSARAQVITKRIGIFIATDLRPYSVVEQPGFKGLINELEPKYHIPSRQHFSGKVIPDLYTEVKSQLIDVLQTAKSISLTTDGWTSKATESYVTITAHFIIDWKIQNYVLQTRPLHESHTGINVGEVIQRAINEWGLSRPGIPIPIVTDNASNMHIAVEHVNGLHIPCLAHTVNLATQRGLQVPLMSRLLGRIRKIVTFFHRSTTANALLKSKQKLLNLPQHKLICDVSTRWNSSYDMMSRYLEQQPAVYATLLSPEIRKNFKELVTLSDDDLTNAQEAVAVLKPLKTVTNILCDESNVTVSLILPLQHRITVSLSHTDDDSQLVKQLKNAISADLAKRYKNEHLRDILLQTSALDPRFKTLPFISETEQHAVFSNLCLTAVGFSSTCPQIKTEPCTQNESDQAGPSLPSLPVLPEQSTSSDSLQIKPGCVSNSEDEEPAIKKCAMEDIFGDVFVTRVQQAKPITERCDQEIIAYRAENAISMSESSLQWWKDRNAVYPLLSKVAEAFLSIPATSVPSERVFSTAGDIVSAQRSSLLPENVDSLIFLKKNLKFK